MSFDDLPRDVRRDVERLARKGQIHPDREVALECLTWAQDYLDPEGGAPGWTALLGDLIGAPGVMSGAHLAKRRLAKRLIALGEPVPE